MNIIPPGTQIDFVKYMGKMVMVSLAIIMVGAVALFFRGGPTLGIDFSGGVLMEIRFAAPTNIAEVRSAMKGADVSERAIQDFGKSSNEFLVRLPLEAGDVGILSKKVTDGLAEKFGKDRFEIRRVEAVGPRVGALLRQRALLAVFASTLMMGLYVWLRFEWRFGVGAAVALVHDVLITLAALVMWNYEFDLSIVAALLTIIGFSVNDTVVICDRIRENRRKDRRSTLAEIINRSINECLGRTVLTSGTALLSVATLYVLGGAVLHGLAFALLVGFFAGVYSTVYIASPIALLFERGSATVRGRKT